MDKQQSDAAQAAEDIVISLKNDLLSASEAMSSAFSILSGLPSALFHVHTREIGEIRDGLSQGLARADLIQNGLRLLGELTQNEPSSHDTLSLATHLGSVARSHVEEIRRITDLVSGLPDGAAIVSH